MSGKFWRDRLVFSNKKSSLVPHAACSVRQRLHTSLIQLAIWCLASRKTFVFTTYVSGTCCYCNLCLYAFKTLFQNVCSYTPDWISPFVWEQVQGAIAPWKISRNGAPGHQSCILCTLTLLLMSRAAIRFGQNLTVLVYSLWPFPLMPHFINSALEEFVYLTLDVQRNRLLQTPLDSH